VVVVVVTVATFVAGAGSVGVGLGAAAGDFRINSGSGELLVRLKVSIGSLWLRLSGTKGSNGRDGSRVLGHRLKTWKSFVELVR
jgi:hypothetical protein